jgi:hypothetical protein
MSDQEIIGWLRTTSAFDNNVKKLCFELAETKL